MSDFTQLNEVMAAVGYMATIYYIVRWFIQKPEVLRVEFKPGVKAKLEKLRSITRVEGIDDVLRNALNVYDTLIFWKRDNWGGMVIFRDRNGEESEFDFTCSD